MVFVFFKLIINIFFIFRRDLRIKKNAGMDQRVLLERVIVKNDSEKIPLIRHNFLKKKLMEQLNSTTISDLYKLNIINEYSFFDDLNPYALKPYNISQGLKW